MNDLLPRTSRPRVLIADNVELFRRGLRDVLVSDGRFAIAAEATRVDDVTSLYARVRPDVAIVAVSSEDEARAALDRVLQVDRGARIILLLSADAKPQLIGVIKAGARGVLRRDASPATILTAVSDVCDGGSALDARLAAVLFRSLASSSAPIVDREAHLAPAVVSLLSQREREVLQALARGYRNKQIGAELGVSVGTVKTHLRHIFRKLQVEDRTAAVLVALDARLRWAA